MASAESLDHLKKDLPLWHGAMAEGIHLSIRTHSLRVLVHTRMNGQPAELLRQSFFQMQEVSR